MIIKIIALIGNILTAVNSQQFSYQNQTNVDIQGVFNNTLERIRRIKLEETILYLDILGLEQYLNSTYSTLYGSGNTSDWSYGNTSYWGSGNTSYWSSNQSSYWNSSQSSNFSNYSLQVQNITVGQFRLADIEYSGLYVRGRAEFLSFSNGNWFMRDIWGTVCDDNFSKQNADVFCKSLGFSIPQSKWASSAENYTQSLSRWYIDSSYPINFDNVRCSGNETNFLDCQYSQSPPDCSHSEDVIISCFTNQSYQNGSNIVEGNLLLANITQYSGKVQGLILFYDQNANSYNTLCDDNQDLLNSAMLCKELNLPYTKASWASYSQNSSLNSIEWSDARYSYPIFNYQYNCFMNSSRLDQCSNKTRLSCTHSEDVYLICDGEVPQSTFQNNNITVGNFRLANIDIPIGGGFTGRAEFYNKTTQLWGTICDDNWFNSYNPKVFCNSLSLPKNYASFTSFNTGNRAPSYNKWNVSGAINMDNVSCATGQESSLDKCSYDYRNDCSHGEDVIVTCQ